MTNSGKSDEDKEAQERQRLYAQTRQELLVRQLSNSEKFDGAILTLSLGALGVSVTFLKDIVGGQQPECLCLLIQSWVLFGLAVISTIISFQVSQRGITCAMRDAHDYYLEKNNDAIDRKNICAQWTTRLNIASAVLFVLALGFTILFVSINLGKHYSEGQYIMKDKPNEILTTTGQANRSPNAVQGGADIPTMQALPLQKGAEIPVMQPISAQPTQTAPATAAPATTTAPAAQPTKTENK